MRKVLVMLIAGLCLIFNGANSQSLKNSELPKVSVIDTNPPELPTCLGQLNARMELSYNLWIFMNSKCEVTFPSDPSGLTECYILANDTNTAMLQADLSAYNRCIDKTAE